MRPASDRAERFLRLKRQPMQSTVERNNSVRMQNDKIIFSVPLPKIRCRAQKVLQHHICRQIEVARREVQPNATSSEMDFNQKTFCLGNLFPSLFHCQRVPGTAFRTAEAVRRTLRFQNSCFSAKTLHILLVFLHCPPPPRQKGEDHTSRLRIVRKSRK